MVHSLKFKHKTNQTKPMSDKQPAGAPVARQFADIPTDKVQSIYFLTQRASSPDAEGDSNDFLDGLVEELKGLALNDFLFITLEQTLRSKCAPEERIGNVVRLLESYEKTQTPTTASKPAKPAPTAPSKRAEPHKPHDQKPKKGGDQSEAFKRLTKELEDSKNEVSRLSGENQNLTVTNQDLVKDRVALDSQILDLQAELSEAYSEEEFTEAATANQAWAQLATERGRWNWIWGGIAVAMSIVAVVAAI